MTLQRVRERLLEDARHEGRTDRRTQESEAVCPMYRDNGPFPPAALDLQSLGGSLLHVFLGPDIRIVLLQPPKTFIMRPPVLLLLVGVLGRSALASDWRACGEGSIKINGVTVHPEPAVAGSPTSFILDTTSSERRVGVSCRTAKSAA
jgi:hypothetical protein